MKFSRILLTFVLLWFISLSPSKYPLGIFVRLLEPCSPQAAALIRTYARDYFFIPIGQSTIRSDGTIVLSNEMLTTSATLSSPLAIRFLIALTVAHESFHLYQLSNRLPFDEHAAYLFEFQAFQDCADLIANPTERENIEKYLRARLAD